MLTARYDRGSLKKLPRDSHIDKLERHVLRVPRDLSPDLPEQRQTEQKMPTPLQIADLGDGMLLRATHRVSSGGGTRRGPFSTVKAPLFHHDGAKSGAVPDDLLWIIEAWPQLNESTKADMIAMVRAVES